jgi:hypothetical protein
MNANLIKVWPKMHAIEVVQTSTTTARMVKKTKVKVSCDETVMSPFFSYLHDNDLERHNLFAATRTANPMEVSTEIMPLNPSVTIQDRKCLADSSQRLTCSGDADRCRPLAASQHSRHRQPSMPFLCRTTV